MYLKEILPYPQKGQWWASKNPLMLHRVLHGNQQVVNFDVWEPGVAIVDAIYIAPMDPSNWVYLWFSESISIEPYFSRWEPLRTGDAFYTLNGEVFFIGEVNTQAKTVRVLSNEAFYLTKDAFPIRLQQGPPDPETTPASSYDRLLGEDTIHEESSPQSREMFQAITELEGIGES